MIGQDVIEKRSDNNVLYFIVRYIVTTHNYTERANFAESFLFVF